MRELDNLCMRCFKELKGGNICSECGCDNDVPNDTMYLPAKTVIKGQ